MDQTEIVITFIIISFALAAVVILKKDSIPPRIRKPLAIFSLIMVSLSFIFMFLSFLGLV